MKDPVYYRGREQTYLKHFFLERYLERVAFNIAFRRPVFTYVDCFSGPWESKDEKREDASFMIALARLRRVREALAEKGAHPRFRCVFIESDRVAFESLRKAVSTVDDFDIELIHGDFECSVDDVVERVGDSFALLFIDPTGWTGFALETIKPLFELDGEVIVNFMFDHINRFIGTDEHDTTFDALFGGNEWKSITADREEALLALYQRRLKEVGGFRFATRTRILKPLADRVYFYLVYGTRHPKGLVEFRGVERQFLEEQERVRAGAKQSRRVDRSGQMELFNDLSAGGSARALDEARSFAADAATGELLRALERGRSVGYWQAIAPMLEVPLVHLSAAKRIARSLHDEGKLRIDGLEGRQRLPNEQCTLSLL